MNEITSSLLGMISDWNGGLGNRVYPCVCYKRRSSRFSV